MSKPSFVFFGTPALSVTILDQLEMAGYVPSLIITREDKPAGRKLILTPPPTKVWAEKRNIPVIQPKSLKTETIVEEILAYAKPLATDPSIKGFDLFIVAAYGRIIPQNVLDIPRLGSLNVHPSLLPRLRGPSPIESAILTEEKTGVSIMVLDADMDHGPILVQETLSVPEDISMWPPYADELESVLAQRGGALLATVLPKYLSGELKGVEQDHSALTICQKIKKEDALLDLSADPDLNVRKVRAYSVWPRAYFFTASKDSENGKDGKETRIIVTRARTEKEGEKTKFIIEKVIPEGKKEMSYADFQKGHKN